MKKLLSILLGTAVVLACTFGAVAASPTDASIVTVSATATESVDPDIAYVNLGVNTLNKDALKATSENAKKMDSITNAIIAMGIAKSDIETSYVSMYPSYDYKDSGKKLTGYEVSNTITITVRDINKVSSVVNTAMSKGVNTLQGVNYDVLDVSETYKKLLPEAVKLARAKADVLAAASGMKTDRVLEISESQSYSPYYSNSFREMAKGEMGVSDASAAIGDTIKPGKIKVSAQVTMACIMK